MNYTKKYTDSVIAKALNEYNSTNTSKTAICKKYGFSRSFFNRISPRKKDADFKKKENLNISLQYFFEKHTEKRFLYQQNNQQFMAFSKIFKCTIPQYRYLREKYINQCATLLFIAGVPIHTIELVLCCKKTKFQDITELQTGRKTFIDFMKLSDLYLIEYYGNLIKHLSFVEKCELLNNTIVTDNRYLLDRNLNKDSFNIIFEYNY